MGSIYKGWQTITNDEIEKKYLGTSYILSRKADFEPRKNIRFHIKNSIHERPI